jgi:hypothetical protein
MAAGAAFSAIYGSVYQLGVQVESLDGKVLLKDARRALRLAKRSC